MTPKGKGASTFEPGLSQVYRNGNVEIAGLMIAGLRKVLNWNKELHDACRGDHLELVKLIVLKGATNWNYGLVGACQGGNLEIAKFMTEEGANNFEEALIVAWVIYQ